MFIVPFRCEAIQCRLLTSSFSLDFLPGLRPVVTVEHQKHSHSKSVEFESPECAATASNFRATGRCVSEVRRCFDASHCLHLNSELASFGVLI